MGSIDGLRWLRARTGTSLPPVEHIDILSAFVDRSPVELTVAAGGQFAPWVATADDVRHSRTLWRQMHLANWNTVPQPLREAGLDRMLRAYGAVIASPRVWDGMTAREWDAVPQPIRTLAYRHMTAYWAGFYRLATTHGLDPALVADTLSAIVMAESWFDHRAVSASRSGNRDLGLAQASDYARQRLRDLYGAGVTDVYLSDGEYFDPWRATRFLAAWMNLLLNESHGDLEIAVRAYHRGIANAHDARGTAYLEGVHRRLRRFIWNLDAPPAWAYLWRRDRELLRREWRWL